MSEAHVHEHSWLLPLVLTLVLFVSALIYLRGWLRLRSDFPDIISTWRLAAFMSGLVLVWAAVASPLTTLDHQSLTIHMVKHLLLMTVAAPLVLGGAPVLPLVCGLGGRFSLSDIVTVGLRTRWLERDLARPVSCWLAGTAAVIGWHLPAAFQLALRYQWVHSVEDTSFLLAGLLFWWPVAQILPSPTGSVRWSMALYLFLATLPCDILSAFLAFCNRVVYPSYLSATQLFGLSPLQDQQSAGALMWVWVTFAYLIPAVVITMQILSPPSTYSREAAEASCHGLTASSVSGSEAEVL
jgi:putative membrane protein